MSVNHPLSRAAAFCLIAALSALVASSCASPTPQEGEVEEEVCEHRGWEGPNDEWHQYAVSSPYIEPDETLLEPPVTQMMVSDGEGVAFIDGKLSQTEWAHKYGSLYIPSTPLLWPDPTVGKRPCHFRILTDIRPLYVTIVGAPGADPDSGSLLGDRLIYECGRFGHRPCVHLNDDGFVEIYPIPEALLDSPYLLIQGRWKAHPNDWTEPTYGDLLALWLFNFLEE